LLQDLNQKTIKQNVNPKKELINKISIHFEEQCAILIKQDSTTDRVIENIQEKQKIKLKVLDLIGNNSKYYKFLLEKSRDEICKAVKDKNLNDPNVIYEVCTNLLENEIIDKNHFFSQLKGANSNEQESVVGLDSNEHQLQEESLDQWQEYSNISNYVIGDNQDNF